MRAHAGREPEPHTQVPADFFCLVLGIQLQCFYKNKQLSARLLYSRHLSCYYICYLSSFTLRTDLSVSTHLVGRYQQCCQYSCEQQQLFARNVLPSPQGQSNKDMCQCLQKTTYSTNGMSRKSYRDDDDDDDFDDDIKQT